MGRFEIVVGTYPTYAEACKVAPRGGWPFVEIEPRYYSDGPVFNTSSLCSPFNLKGEDTLESFIKKITQWTR